MLSSMALRRVLICCCVIEFDRKNWVLLGMLIYTESFSKLEVEKRGNRKNSLIIHFIVIRGHSNSLVNNSDTKIQIILILSYCLAISCNSNQCFNMSLVGVL